MSAPRLTPTETLICEVLAARLRLGETCWTFERRHRRALESLVDKKLLVEVKALSDEGLTAFPSDTFREEFLMRGYRAIGDEPEYCGGCQVDQCDNPYHDDVEAPSLRGAVTPRDAARSVDGWVYGVSCEVLPDYPSVIWASMSRVALESQVRDVETGLIPCPRGTGGHDRLVRRRVIIGPVEDIEDVEPFDGLTWQTRVMLGKSTAPHVQGGER